MSAQNERVQASCKIIWGEADYDFDLETDDWVTYAYVVRKDFGSRFGPPLTMTGICNSETHAWEELERMLSVWARQVQSGKPMTKSQSIEIFGGPNWRNSYILGKFIDEAERRGINH